MKYMLSWNERSQGSPMEYENAQKRILEVFTQWKAPDNFKIEMFVIRVGDWGGYMLLDCDEPLAVHKFCSMLPSFEFQARPVVPVMDAVRVELIVVARLGDDGRHRQMLGTENVVPVGVGQDDVANAAIAEVRDQRLDLGRQQARIDEARLSLRHERAGVVVEVRALPNEEAHATGTSDSARAARASTRSTSSRPSVNVS